MEDVGNEAVGCVSDCLKVTKCEGVVPCSPLSADSLHNHKGGIWCVE